MSRHSLFSLRPRAVAASAWLALFAAAQALAAPLDLHLPQLHGPPSPPDLLLIGAGVVLVLALGFALMRRPTRTPNAHDGPDLRWWKNPPE